MSVLKNVNQKQLFCKKENNKKQKETTIFGFLLNP